MELSRAEALQWLARTEPTLIVVGSGISLSQPTSAPSVWPFLERTTLLMEEAAGFTPVDRGYVKRIFPESCYGAIAEAFQTDTLLKVWNVFSWATANDLGAHPNAGHMAVAALAAERRWPVITTNFDRFIEAAAWQQGLRVDVSLPPQRPRATAFAQMAGAVTLVKVHGTAGAYQTIRSTAADLSRLSRVIGSFTFEPEVRRVLVIGYSGRDLDLFPFIARQAAACDVLWVDPKFDADHRAHTLANTVRYQGAWEDLASDIVPAVMAVPSPRPSTSLEGAYLAEVRRLVDTHIGELFTGDPGRTIAALTGALAAAGAHGDVCRLAEHVGRVRDRRSRFETLQWAAHAASSTDRFTTARRLIRRARSDALRMASLSGLGRCAVAMSFAGTADVWLSVVPAERVRTRVKIERLWPLFRVLWTTAAYALPFVIALYRLHRATGLPKTAVYRFAADYLEHCVRLMSLLERLRRRSRWIGGRLDHLWRLLESACASIGYTWGVLNVSKYRSREHARFKGPEGSVTRANVMGDLVGKTIALRDAARHYLEAAAGMTEGADWARGVELLDGALETAQELGGPTLELKIRLIRRQYGIDGPYERAAIERVLDLAECRAMVHEREVILRALTEPASITAGSGTRS
ncbi:SIR2 family protein [Catellatospora sp. NPDC049111]|uniref:SIR2 family protein n=1 Tax=Catellatospora sp. NPDC049111 TaxID=3155271 RepID=UPI0033E586CC